jgi:hypothetical protein
MKRQEKKDAPRYTVTIALWEKSRKKEEEYAGNI